MVSDRRPIYVNPGAKHWVCPKAPPAPDLIQQFHETLPSFQPTRLTPLDGVAKELGLARVFVKDESDRLGLPSFKILGASWGTYKAVVRELGLPDGVSLEDVRKAASQKNLTLVTATEGNHGRAVARVGHILCIPTEIHVPGSMSKHTVELISGEGAEVLRVRGYYDDAVAVSQKAAESDGYLLVQDFASGDYVDIPQWIVDGYSTMMREIDEQLKEYTADLVITPVGVGSLAQAVVTHFKREGSRTSVATVEADTAACLWKSLREGNSDPKEIGHTIMAGLECGTVTATAWPLLQAGVGASVTVSDFEAHRASLELGQLGVSAGPCGAASLAALRRLSVEQREALGLNSESTVVILNTEGPRDYDIPVDASLRDAVALTQALVRLDSTNPMSGGHGETSVARYIQAWCEHRDIETHWIEPTAGRPSVIGVVRGSSGGQSLMLNGHTDVVTTASYEGNPFTGEIKGNRLYGRGSADMKGGLAAAMVALASAKQLDLRGDVILAAVADEEAMSIGTEQILAAGWRADGAVVNEPTNHEIIHAHKGFVWLEVVVSGRASHGSRPDLGVDAITRAGYFLVQLDRYSKELGTRAGGDILSAPSVHASVIKGGEEESSYPASCTIALERRTVAGETVETVREEIQGLIDKVSEQVEDFQASLKVTFQRDPFELPKDHAFTKLLADVVQEATGTEPVISREPYWTDAALLASAGIPSLIWGPKGEGLHAKEEWVEVDSVKLVADGLTEVAKRFCK